MKREERLGGSGLMPDARRQRTMSPQFVPLRAPLTSASWNGDSYSTAAKALIDLSAVFGVPANAKAIAAELQIRDSGSAGGDYVYRLSPNNVAGSGPSVRVSGLPNDTWTNAMLTVPCNSDGDVYYQIAASGAGTMDIWLWIWGYWL